MKKIFILLLSLLSLASFGQTNDASLISEIDVNVRKKNLTSINVAAVLDDIVHSKQNIISGVTASGTDNTYTATVSSTVTSYTVGQQFLVKFTNANTDASTINFNSNGAKALKKNVSSALVAGDISAGQVMLLAYDGTNFQIIGGSSVGLPSQTGNIGKFLQTDGTSPLWANPSVNGLSVAFRDSVRRLVSIFVYGKRVTIFGDSYVAGIGPSSLSLRWTTILCQYLGAIENNQGVSGTTLEKRSPVDWAASPNMVDNIHNIPIKTTSEALLILAFGLNDLGYAGGSYTPANFISDYTTVLDSAINLKHWDPSQILILTPYFIGQTGYNTYNGENGTTPTRARHLDFVQAAKTVSKTFQTLLCDIYTHQRLNDSTLHTADGVHANNAGHYYIANDIYSYLYANQLKYGNINVDNMTINNAATTPLFVGAGAAFGSLSDHQSLMFAGCYFDGSGFKTNATSTSAAIINLGNNQANQPGLSAYFDESLTANTGFTPTEKLRYGSTGWFFGMPGVTMSNANSTLQSGGSFALKYVAKTANYTLTDTDYLVNCTSNSFTVTMPTAVGITGRIYIIKNTGSGTITLATTSGQTIDGSAPGTLSAGPTIIKIMSDGANWITL